MRFVGIWGEFRERIVGGCGKLRVVEVLGLEMGLRGGLCGGLEECICDVGGV